MLESIVSKLKQAARSDGFCNQDRKALSRPFFNGRSRRAFEISDFCSNRPTKRGPILELIEESYPAETVHRDMEKFALFRALVIASERGFKRVKLRSDYSQMRTQLKEDHKSGLIYERDDLHRM